MRRNKNFEVAKWVTVKTTICEGENTRNVEMCCSESEGEKGLVIRTRRIWRQPERWTAGR